MKEESILIIGGSGFFGKSILDYFSRNLSLKKSINQTLGSELVEEKSYKDFQASQTRF